MATRILIADDARLMRRIIKDIVLEAGYEVVGEASTGQQAFELYKSFRPDVMTMDVIMPELDGIEVLRLIMDYDPTARVIICSALGHDMIIDDAMKAGAKSYIIKPFKKDKVIESLKRVLAL